MFLTRRSTRAIAIGAGALAVLGAGWATARPLVPAERREIPYSGIIKACNDPSATSSIQDNFAATEDEYWHSGLAIVGFDEVREIGFRSNGLDYIPRRYCTARAIMSDQKVRTVSYAIVEDGGSIGFTDNVVWCVSGLDRQDGYAPNCKMARP